MQEIAGDYGFVVKRDSIGKIVHLSIYSKEVSIGQTVLPKDYIFVPEGFLGVVVGFEDPKSNPTFKVVVVKWQSEEEEMTMRMGLDELILCTINERETRH